MIQQSSQVCDCNVIRVRNNVTNNIPQTPKNINNCQKTLRKLKDSSTHFRSVIVGVYTTNVGASGPTTFGVFENVSMVLNFKRRTITVIASFACQLIQNNIHNFRNEWQGI